MFVFQTLRYGTRRLPALAAGLVIFLGAACSGDESGIAGESALPADSTLAGLDSTAGSDSAGTPPAAGPAAAASLQHAGIVFGSFNMEPTLLNTVHTGSMRGGGVTGTNVGSLLSAVRAKGGRIVLKLCNGKDSYVKNGDGTFSFTKWKGLVDRFRSSGLDPYIADGTLLGHYLIDEPHRASRWGGQIISPATLEAMAMYSKQLWPGMTTFVRVAPTWLASYSTAYTHLDAGWAQYASGKGGAEAWIAAEVAAAERKGLGLVVGLNVLDGGNGSSGIRGRTPGKYSMSASEIRAVGSGFLGQSYACGFYNWSYDLDYYGRSDIKSAMADLSSKARSHAQTSCKQ